MFQWNPRRRFFQSTVKKSSMMSFKKVAALAYGV
jgi:hypothetical protein